MSAKRPTPKPRVRKHGAVTPVMDVGGEQDQSRLPLIGETAYADPWWYRAPRTRIINQNRVIRQKGFQAYMDMREDDQVKAALKFKKLTVTSSGWQVEKPEEIKGEDVYTNLVKECFDNMPGRFDDALQQMMTALDFGVSYTEKIYEMEGPIAVLRALKTRDPRPFQFDIDPFGNVLNIVQQGVDSKLPLAKFIVFTYQSEFGNPYGKPDLDAAYDPYWYKLNFWQFIGCMLERYGVPPAIMLYNAAAFDAGQIGNIKNILTNLQAPTNALIPRPTKDDLELMFPEVSGQVSTAFIPALQECDRRIARALLMPGLLGMTSDAETGSLARSQTHFDVFMLVVEELRNSLQNAVQEQIVDQLCELNFPKRACGWPQFKFIPLTEGDTAALFTQWRELVGAGVVKSTAADEAVIRARLEMPERPQATDTDYAAAPNPYAPPPQAQPNAPPAVPTQAPAPQAPVAAPPTGTEPLPTGGSGNVIDTSLEGVTLNGAQITAVLDVLAQLTAGTIQPDVAVALIAAVGVQEATAQGIVASQTSPQAIADAQAGQPAAPAGDMTGAGGPPGSRTDAGGPAPPVQPEPTGVPEREGKSPGQSEQAAILSPKRFAEEGTYHRPLTKAEGRVNFTQVSASLDAIELRGAGAIQATLRRSRDELDRMVRADLADGQLDVVQNLNNLPYAEALVPDVNAMLLAGYGYGRASIAQELSSQFTDKTKVRKFETDVNYIPQDAVNYLNTKAVTVAGTIDARITANVKNVLLSAIKTGMAQAEIIQALDAVFDPYLGAPEKTASQLETIVRTNMTDAFNQGRLIQARAAEDIGVPLTGYQYSAILDARTTDVCKLLDDKFFRADDPDVDRLAPPRHFNCRSVLVPLTIDTGTMGTTPITEAEKAQAIALSGEGF